MILEASYECAFCGETIWTSVDPSAGRRQSYTEDCQVCCSPNLLEIELERNDEGDIDVYIRAEQEYQ